MTYMKENTHTNLWCYAWFPISHWSWQWNGYQSTSAWTSNASAARSRCASSPSSVTHWRFHVNLPMEQAVQGSLHNSTNTHRYKISTYIHIYIHTHIHTYIHTYHRLHIIDYIHTRIHTYKQTNKTYIIYIPYIHTRIHTHTYIHTYKHTYIHRYIHTYTHTHYITLHCITGHYITYITYITLRYITSNNVTVHTHLQTLHYITLQYITLHTLHTYISYIHTYMHS